jgi:IS5 family transposase
MCEESAAGHVAGRAADKGYDFARRRAHLKGRGIVDRIARRGIERNDRLGRHRWVVERTQAWLAAFGKLRIRFERSIHTHLALLSLACCVLLAALRQT